MVATVVVVVEVETVVGTVVVVGTTLVVGASGNLDVQNDWTRLLLDTAEAAAP